MITFLWGMVAGAILLDMVARYRRRVAERIRLVRDEMHEDRRSC
jgi:hypothetical protein